MSSYLLGILYAVGAVICFGIASTLMKYVSRDNDNPKLNVTFDLLMQHGFIAFCALVVGAVISRNAIIPVLNLTQVGRYFLVFCVVGYAGIRALLKGMEKENAGVVMIVASLNVFIGFLINIWFFPESESLSWIKIVLSVVFFAVIALFMLAQGTHKKIQFNRYLLYPVLTAVCRAIYASAKNLLIKQGVMEPPQLIFLSEFLVFVGAAVAYLVQKKADFSIFDTFTVAQLKPYFFIGLFNVINVLLMGFAYQLIPANIANFVGLFSIIVTAVLSSFFLNDHLSRRQTILMVVAFIVLTAFILL